MQFSQQLENVPEKKTLVTHKKAKPQMFSRKSIFATFQKILAQFCSSNPEGSHVHWRNINCIKLKHRNTDMLN